MNGAAELLWPACSLKFLFCSPYRNQQRQQSKPGQGKNQRQSQLSYSYLPYMLFSITCRAAHCKKGTCSIFNSDSTFCYWQKIELECCYAATRTLFKRTMARVKMNSVRIYLFYVNATAPDVINKGIIKAKLSLTINSGLFVLYLSHQGQIKHMGQCHVWIICRRLAKIYPPTVSQHCNN